MKTTFILHGGATSDKSKDNDKFFSYFTSLIYKKSVKILMCYFAREKDSWKDLLKRDGEKIEKKTNKKITFAVPEKPEELIKLLPGYDILYVAGGSAELIEPLYAKLDSIKQLLKGKVYIGSSMGAFMVSSNYVLSLENQDISIHKGLGLLPFNLLVHWNKEKKKEYKIEMLKNVSDLPILILDEYESLKIVL